jgi:hypothetical protein
MHTIFSPLTFPGTELTCGSCGWTGTGAKAVQEVLSLTDATEVYCPRCRQYLGFISTGESSKGQEN